MTLWIIEPQDPLIVRDGRPFNATPGARARSLPFPFPSTIAGGARTRAGLDGNGIFDKANIEAVKKIVVRGPLLTAEGDDGKLCFLVPAPADALVFDDEQEEKKVVRKWLRPLALLSGANHDKPANLPPYLVGLPSPDNRKPSKKAPRFWHWDQFAAWLLDPEGETALLKPAELGHDGPRPDRRIHVKIDPMSFTGKDGMLFVTSGLTFWHREKNDDESPHNLSQTKKLALAAEVESSLPIAKGFAPLGGERRLMNWRQVTEKLPTEPDDLVDKIIANDGYCRLILLTPTYFEDGWHPSHFGPTEGATVTLQAAAVPNPVVVSGWDFAGNPPGPKRTRRLAPAGSVYFVKVEGDVQQWVKDRWLRALSDDAELVKAGFGVTAVGVWDGKKPTIQLKEESNG